MKNWLYSAVISLMFGVYAIFTDDAVILRATAIVASLLLSGCCLVFWFEAYERDRY